MVSWTLPGTGESRGVTGHPASDSSSWKDDGVFLNQRYLEKRQVSGGDPVSSFLKWSGRWLCRLWVMSKWRQLLGVPRRLHALSQKIVPFSIRSKLLSASHYLVGSGMNICSGQSQTWSWRFETKERWKESRQVQPCPGGDHAFCCWDPGHSLVPAQSEVWLSTFYWDSVKSSNFTTPIALTKPPQIQGCVISMPPLF